MIPVNIPDLGPLERQYVLQCLEEGWISSEGPWIPRLEAACATRFERRYAIAVANGSVALDAALVALSLRPGDEVILPSMTIISCAAAVVRAGAVPVFVDADPVTWCMDVGQIAGRITERTRAIMPVHIYGLPVDMTPLLELAARHGLQIIEDAAESHGQTYGGRACGSFGDLSTFSFYANKHVTTGEGGMILTDDDALAARCRSLRNLCFVPERRFVHEELGWNYRMASLQAALGLAQIERLDEFIVRKRAMGKRYTELLTDVPGLQLPPSSAYGSDNHYWVYAVVLNDEVALDALEAMRLLAAEGVATRPFFWPLHEQPVLNRMGYGIGDELPVASRIARRGFYLPSGLGLSANDLEQVGACVRRLVNSHS